jgi:hypothetical protein
MQTTARRHGHIRSIRISSLRRTTAKSGTFLTAPPLSALRNAGSVLCARLAPRRPSRHAGDRGKRKEACGVRLRFLSSR